MRIAKYIAASGLCSRRKAEEWVIEGRVAVDGKRLDSPAFNVPEGAAVTVDGKPVKAQEDIPRLWLFHKPDGCISTRSDPQGRPTVFDRLPKELSAEKGRLLTVGRLDYSTEGLLLLTNNGDLANGLTHPSRGWERIYRCRVFGMVDEGKLKALAKGVTLTDSKGKRVSYGPIRAKLETAPKQGRNRWLEVAITEGRNREVRNICAHLGLEVSRLIRTHYGPFMLAELARGAVQEVPFNRVQKLLKEAGRKNP